MNVMEFTHLIQRYTVVVISIMVMLVVMNVALIIGWHASSRTVTVYVPPSIPTAGVLVEPGKPSKATVYSFAFYVLQQLNNWQRNGAIDDKHNIEQLLPLLTPSFRVNLEQTYESQLTQGELQQRLRQLSISKPYSSKDVTELTKRSFNVTLTMRLTERISGNAALVKDILVRYRVKVIVSPISRKLNKWGLQLAGFVQPPKRVRTLI